MPFLPAGYRAICSTEFVVLHPKNIAQSFLYGVLSSTEFLGRLVARAGGTSASHQRVKPNDLLSMVVVQPPAEIVDDFARIAEPVPLLVENLRQKNDTLRRTRDLLLPRLISGEIEVVAMEEELAGAA
jgi:type I restriction enzyme, S subunit